jgi:hypothetical protein
VLVTKWTPGHYSAIRKDKVSGVVLVVLCSASSRISKGQGYRGFLRKRAGSSLRRTRKNLKNGQNFITFRVNKMFSHKF